MREEGLENSILTASAEGQGKEWATEIRHEKTDGRIENGRQTFLKSTNYRKL